MGNSPRTPSKSVVGVINLRGFVKNYILEGSEDLFSLGDHSASFFVPKVWCKVSQDAVRRPLGIFSYMGRITVSQTKRQMIFARDNWRCCYCGEKAILELKEFSKPMRRNIVPIGKDKKIFEIDHILPVCQGGNNSFNNLVTTCWDCNNRKSGEYQNPIYYQFRVKMQ